MGVFLPTDTSGKAEIPVLLEVVDDSLAAIAARIALARKQAGMGQRELASDLGVSERQVRNYEKAITAPYAQLDQIAASLNVSKEWLLTGASVEERLRQLEAEREEIISMLTEVRGLVTKLLRPPEGLMPPEGDTPRNEEDPPGPTTPEEDPPPPDA